MTSTSSGQEPGRPLRSAAEHRTQRTLVVVPGSHLENDLAKQRLQEMKRLEQSDPLISVPNRHGIRIAEIWDKGSQEVRDYRQRALQLDLRATCMGCSCKVIWNSSTIHQGCSTLSPDMGASAEAFIPPLYTPPAFAVENVREWRKFLDSEGYVVLRDVLETPMDSILESLLRDINEINPGANIPSLDDVVETHLGIHRRGLRYTLGFPHGEFAWAIRQDRRVRRIWQDLHDVRQVMGSTDVPALTRREAEVTLADSKTHDEWLHWDQNPLLPPFGQPMYQSMVYLFPESASTFGGSTWNRIAMVVCMVPTAYGRDGESEKTLLALAMTGEASNHWPQIGRANYGWAGMRMDEMDATRINLTSQEIDGRAISMEKLREKRWKRILPELNPDLTLGEVRKIVSDIGIRLDDRAHFDFRQMLELIQSVDYKVLRHKLELSNLRRIVHPRVKEYVRFVAPRS